MIIHGKDSASLLNNPGIFYAFSTLFFPPSRPTSILKSLYPSIHKVINETFKAFWIVQRHCVSKSERQSERARQRKEKGSREGEQIVERAQMYSQLKAVRSCSFHGPIRIKSIPQHHHPLQPHAHTQTHTSLSNSEELFQQVQAAARRPPEW